MNQSQDTDRFNLIRSLIDGQNLLSGWTYIEGIPYPEDAYTRYDLMGRAIASIVCESSSYDDDDRYKNIFHLRFLVYGVQNKSRFGCFLYEAQEEADTLLRGANYILTDAEVHPP